MTTPWHMARVASRRQLPKPRKMMGASDSTYWPAFLREQRERTGLDLNQVDLEKCCRDCGHHVCSCKPVELMPNGPFHTIIIRPKHPNGCPCVPGGGSEQIEA